MKTNRKSIILSLVLIFILAACNYPGMQALATPTPTPTKRPATATPAPPTVTPMPSDTPPPPATNTPPPPPPTLPPTIRPTNTHAPTSTPSYPSPGAKYLAKFEGGKIVFRVSDSGREVTLKEVVLESAVCSGSGKKVSTRFDYPNAAFVTIEHSSFSVSNADLTVSGTFYNPPIGASGSVTVQVKTAKVRCTFGPASWTAKLTQ